MSTLLGIMITAYVIGVSVLVYAWLWMYSWAERAWQNPDRTDIPVWRWLLKRLKR